MNALMVAIFMILSPLVLFKPYIVCSMLTVLIHFSGQYSLVEPDGSIRTVDYTADPIHGFNAV